MLLGLALLSQGAAALPRPIEIDLDAANSLAGAAVAACRAQGRAIAVSIVDRGGNLVAVQRSDGVGPHNTHASRKKAFTALSTRSSTLDLARNAAFDPDARNLASLPELLLLGGGVQAGAEQAGGKEMTGDGVHGWTPGLVR